MTLSCAHSSILCACNHYTRWLTPTEQQLRNVCANLEYSTSHTQPRVARRTDSIRHCLILYQFSADFYANEQTTPVWWYSVIRAGVCMSNRRATATATIRDNCTDHTFHMSKDILNVGLRVTYIFVHAFNAWLPSKNQFFSCHCWRGFFSLFRFGEFSHFSQCGTLLAVWWGHSKVTRSVARNPFVRVALRGVCNMCRGDTRVTH